MNQAIHQISASQKKLAEMMLKRQFSASFPHLVKNAAERSHDHYNTVSLKIMDYIIYI